MAFLESLSYARGAYRPPTEALANADIVSQLSDMIYRIKAADLDYACAADLLRGYQKSKQAMISLAALGTVLDYESLIELDKETVAFVKRAAAPGPHRLSPGDLAEKMADLRLRRSETWEGFPAAAPLITYALVSVPGEGSKVRSLVISSKQRAAIIQKLEQGIGPEVKVRPKDDVDPILLTGMILYHWITEDWETSDGEQH